MSHDYSSQKAQRDPFAWSPNQGGAEPAFVVLPEWFPPAEPQNQHGESAELICTLDDGAPTWGVSLQAGNTIPKAFGQTRVLSCAAAEPRPDGHSLLDSLTAGADSQVRVSDGVWQWLSSHSAAPTFSLVRRRCLTQYSQKRKVPPTTPSSHAQSCLVLHNKLKGILSFWATRQRGNKESGKEEIETKRRVRREGRAWWLVPCTGELPTPNPPVQATEPWTTCPVSHLF